MYIDIDGTTHHVHTDSSHPWPYYEGHAYDGCHFTFYVPRTITKEEKQLYAHKLRSQRDVIGITWQIVNPNLFRNTLE